MKKKAWIVSFITIMIVSSLLCGCGVQETSSKVENTATKIEESKVDVSKVEESKVEDPKVEESKVEDIKEGETEQSPENSIEEEVITEKEISLLIKKIEHKQNGSEDIIQGITEYEYGDLALSDETIDWVLSMETKYSALGEVRNYSEYIYYYKGRDDLVRVDDYGAAGDGHMYKCREHIYESGNEIRKNSLDTSSTVYEFYEYKYDSQGNLIYEHRNIPSYNRINGRKEYSYNEFGEMVEERFYDEKGSCSYTIRYAYNYNEHNKPVEKYEILSNEEKKLLQDYKYDDNGNLVETIIYDHSQKLTYEYNENNKLIKECKYDHYGEVDMLNSWIEYEYEVYPLLRE